MRYIEKSDTYYYYYAAISIIASSWTIETDAMILA